MRTQLATMQTTPGRARVFLMLLGLALAAGSAPASASTIGYGDFTGSNVVFQGVTESSASPGAFFGAPVVAGDSIQFFPLDFLAAASNGGTDTLTADITLTVVANAGSVLTAVDISQLGDYQLIGAGSSASASSDLSVSDLASSMIGSDSATSSFAQGSGAPFGNFQNDLSVDLSGLNLTAVTLRFASTLQATAGSPGTSLIQTKIVSGPTISIATAPSPLVPEPTAFLAFAVGLATVAAAARRAAVAAPLA